MKPSPTPTSPPLTSPTPAAEDAAPGAGARGTAGRASGSLGAELRESLLLLIFAGGTTLGLTVAAQAALAALD